jgi:hypothetical protein
MRPLSDESPFSGPDQDFAVTEQLAGYLDSPIRKTLIPQSAF